jgi:superfamily I DNA/RNA helicase
LLEEVNSLLNQGISSLEIGYLAFTRAAAQEVISRVLNEYPSKEKQLFPYFKTLHSLSSSLLELHRENFLTTEHLDDFCKSKGYEYNSLIQENEENPYEWLQNSLQIPHVFFNINSFGIHRQLHPTQAWGQYPSISEVKAGFNEYYNFIEAYNDFKKEKGLLDYDDILINILKSGILPPFSYLFVDEFQDFSPLMYEIFLQWEPSMEKVIIAGDPYQSIYTFMGANSVFLSKHPSDKRIVLPKSHRLKTNHLRQVQSLLRDAEFDSVLPQTEGGIIYNYHTAQIDLTKELTHLCSKLQANDRVFLLTRTNYNLTKIMDALIQHGIPFKTYRGYTPWTSAICDLHNGLIKYSQGEELSLNEVRAILDPCPVKNFLKRGIKSQIQRLVKGEITPHSVKIPLYTNNKINVETFDRFFLSKPTLEQLLDVIRLTKWHKTALKQKLSRSKALVYIWELFIQSRGKRLILFFSF